MRTPSRGVILAISSLSIIFVMATSGLAQDGVYEKALAKYKEGDFRGAAALLAAKSPKTSGDYNLLGWARLKDGKEDDAVKQFEFSLSLDTSAYNSYCGLGYAYYRKGKFAAAAGYFKKGMRRDPECASGHYEALKKLSAEAAGKNAGPAKPAPPPDTSKDFFSAAGTRLAARTAGRYFEVYRGGKWERMLVKGVNIGASVPGRWFGEVAASREQYKKWLEQISAMNANTVRVYTLLSPDFYAALADFDRANPGRRLWLIQEIWPPDTIPGNDLFSASYEDEYRREIDLDLDALAGKASIQPRPGQAYGDFSSDVTPYLLGVLVGREIMTEEAKATDEANPGLRGFEGKYVRAEGSSSALETWLAQESDYVQGRLQEKYGIQVPVGFVSWPTLDPMDHPTELDPDDSTKKNKREDSQVMDPSHLRAGPGSKAGFFGAYHIYPYYPEFMYRDPAYASYRDAKGTLRYGGYLKHFMSVLPAYPQLIAEFGIPTSLAALRINPDGLSQGMIEEKQQGQFISRMMRAIVKEGYAGGIVFEWADEWAKRSWGNIMYMLPQERHIYWHNVMDPEQNFGLMAEDPAHKPFSGRTAVWKAAPGKKSLLTALYADSNEEYLFLELDLKRDMAAALLPGSGGSSELFIALDTLGDGHGTVRLPVKGLPALSSGAEFLVRVSAADGARFLARPDYNRGVSKFAAAPASDDVFEEISYPVTREIKDPRKDAPLFPALRTSDSRLVYGVFDPASPLYNSRANWNLDAAAGKFYLRLPWTLLNVSDPSSNTVICDASAGPAGLREPGDSFPPLRTQKTPGFRFYSALTAGGALADFQPRDGAAFRAGQGPYLWRGWDQPAYRDRLKGSYREVLELFKDIKQPR
jgi:hypothetical protein